MSDVQINLTALQRTIAEQLRADETNLAALRRQVDQVTARINANRGKLDLLADLMAASTNDHGQVDGGE